MLQSLIFIVPVNYEMFFLLLLFIKMSVIQSISAEDCYYVLSTRSLTQHINYTGDACRWTVIAPESQKIVLTLQRFAVQRPDIACTVYLNVYDEESSARPVCPGLDRLYEYVSEGNMIHINLTNVSGNPVMSSFEASFRGAEDYFSCDFNTAADCTGRVAENSSWIHSATENDVCAIMTAVQGPRLGLFYQTAYSSDSLNISPLLPGKYVFDAEVIATCSMQDFRQYIFLTFCNITRRYSLREFYFNWSTFFELIECNTVFEVTTYASPGAMVVAMDNIRLMKVIDETLEGSTLPTFTTNMLITFYHTEPSGFQQRRVLICVCSAVIFVLVVTGVGCILVYKRIHKVNEHSETQIKATFDNRIYDSSNSQGQSTIMPHQYDAVGNNGYTITSESEYQDVNGTAMTEGYHYIHDPLHLGYESMLPGVQSQELNQAVNTHSLEDSAKLQVEDGTYYISTGNEYQVMNTPVNQTI